MSLHKMPPGSNTTLKHAQDRSKAGKTDSVEKNLKKEK